jgi:hypothetical protein
MDLFLRKASDLSPKFECIRLFLVRYEKKIVHCVLEGKRFKFCCPQAKEALVQLIIDNRDDLSSSNAAGTKSDPSQNPEFSSFKAALSKHFSNSVMSDLHDFMIVSIFTALNKPSNSSLAYESKTTATPTTPSTTSGSYSYRPTSKDSLTYFKH